MLTLLFLKYQIYYECFQNILEALVVQWHLLVLVHPCDPRNRKGYITRLNRDM